MLIQVAVNVKQSAAAHNHYKVAVRVALQFPGTILVKSSEGLNS
jgi:hypothetical protein